MKPTVLMLILLLLSPHSTSVVQSTSELNQDIVSHSTDGNISSIQHNTLTWNSINLMNEVIYSDSNVVMYLSDWTDNGGISFTDQFGTREYSVISMSGFYANCGSLTTNPTSYYHGLPNEGSDGFLYYSVNSHILQLKEENQFSTNIITISEEGISFTQELKGSANLDSSSPIYNGEWVLESNVANLQPTQLIRLGLFIDQTVSMVDLQALCLEMFNAHAVLISTFDVTVQIEFIKTIQKQDTATVAGYGQVDASLCENDELKDYLRTNAYELMENGRMLSSIQSTTDYTRYNRGKYLDHIVYYSDDSYWDWKKVDQDGNEYSIRGCADWGDADHMPSVVRMHDDDGDSWTYHTYLHEMGHTFGIRHDTGTCTEPPWYYFWKPTIASIMSTYKVSADGECAYDVREERFSSASQTKGNLVTSDAAVPNLPIQRISSIPLVKTQSNHQLTLLSFHVDLMSDSEGGPTECEKFYRSYYHVQNDMTTSVSVTEFFIGIRSDYVRGAPGEWDYWLGYDRHTHVLGPGDDYVYMKHSASKSGIGWISDSSTDYNSSTDSFTCIQHKDTAYRNHHPNQGGSPAEWRFHVVYNTAGIFSPSYKQYYFAEIKFDVGV